MTELQGRACAVAAVAVATLLGANEGAVADERGEPRFDVCRTQIVEDVERRFDHTVTDILFRHIFDRDDFRRFNFGQAVVSVAECAGYHFYEIRATADTCERLPHYGRVPRYIFYRSSGDGC